ncbi:MAG: NAD(P)-dependent oxidoreductase [Terriglobia bacterium]|jgi:3-hydroxyisobutyrate dehydrogenase-like beta-hydroxyacid dehydrogenase
MRVGWIGLGNMGQAMARNLIKAGHELLVYNRTRSRAVELEAEGARLADSPAEAATAPVVVTMLADDAAVEDVIFGSGKVLKALREGNIHIAMSTISASLSKRLAEAHGKKGQAYVAAPVFGRPEAAAAAKLFIVAAGPREAVERCQPLFDAMGQKTYAIGEDAPAAHVVKLAGNFMIASVIETLGEAFALVRKYGIEPGKFLEFVTTSLFAAPVYKTYATLVAEDKYQPVGFRLALGLKDARLALAAAEAAAVPMPVASLIRDRLLAAMARGMQDADWASFARLAAENAGLKPMA